MRTWIPWVAVVGLMAVAIGGATWSAFFASERSPGRFLEAYAEKVCINDDVRWELISVGGHERIHHYREWATVAAAERDLKAHRWQLRALTPPAGLGRFQAAALDALGTALDELGEQDDSLVPVQVTTIPLGGLPSSGGIREALWDLPGDIRELMRDHGCYAAPLVE